MLIYLVNISLTLYGAFFTGAALMKLSRHKHMLEEFEQMQLPYWLAVLSGAIEVVCGPAMLLGIWLPGVAGLAVLAMTCTMFGAAVVNFIGRTAPMAGGVALLFVLPMALLSYYHLDQVTVLLAG